MQMGAYTGRAARRRGGVGWGRLLVVILGVVAALMGATAVFNPWAYYLGGHFHIVPAWRGVGSFVGPDGEYQLYVSVKPWPQGKGLHLDTSLNGYATLCTPRGERIFMKVSAGMDRRLPVDTVGKQINISAYERNAAYRFWEGVSKPGGARLGLKGVWGEGRIDATGTVRSGSGAAPVSFAAVLKETDSWIAPACPGR